MVERTPKEIAMGKGELPPDDQDYIDSLETGVDLDAGLFGQDAITPEERLEREAQQQEATDLLEGLRQIQSADPIRWSVWRTGSADPEKDGFLTKLSGSQLTYERLRDSFGGGTYKIRGNYTNGKYAAQRTIIIADDAPRREKSNMQGNGASPFNITEFFAQQEARDLARRREDELREQRRQEREDAQRRENKDLYIGLATALAPAIAGLFGNRGPDVGSLLTALKPAPQPTLLETMTALKQLAAPAESSDPMDKALKVIEVLKDAGGLGTNETGTNMLDVLKELAKSAGPVVGGLLEQAAARAQATAETPAPVPERRALPAPSDAEVAAPSPISTAQGGPMMGLLAHLSWLRGQLSRLIPAAQKQRDPAAYAAVFLEELPEGLDPQEVLGLLARPTWLQDLSQLDARVAQFPEWFTVLHQTLVTELQAIITPTPAPAPAATARPAPAQVERPQGVPSLMGDGNG